MEMYDHEDDSDAFAEYMQELGGTPNISVNLPVGETLVVNGPRLTPLVVTVSNRAERSPKRDARMLATALSTSLDEQTILYLTEYLFTEHLAPLMKDTQALFQMQQASMQPPKKKSPPKPKNDDSN